MTQIPPLDTLVHCGSDQHPNLYKALTLLRLRVVDPEYPKSGSPVYFIVESLASIDSEDPLDQSYFYEEHTCPTNFIRIEAIFTPTDDDPHGLFEHVRSVWMTIDYVEARDGGAGDEWLRNVFPETRET